MFMDVPGVARVSMSLLHNSRSSKTQFLARRRPDKIGVLDLSNSKGGTVTKGIVFFLLSLCPRLSRHFFGEIQALLGAPQAPLSRHFWGAAGAPRQKMERRRRPPEKIGAAGAAKQKCLCLQAFFLLQNFENCLDLPKNFALRAAFSLHF